MRELLFASLVVMASAVCGSASGASEPSALQHAPEALPTRPAVAHGHKVSEGRKSRHLAHIGSKRPASHGSAPGQPLAAGASASEHATDLPIAPGASVVKASEMMNQKRAMISR